MARNSMEKNEKDKKKCELHTHLVSIKQELVLSCTVWRHQSIDDFVELNAFTPLKLFECFLVLNFKFINPIFENVAIE